MNVTPQLTLKQGRERSLLRRHPWIFSGAIAEVRGAPHTGDSVGVRAADGSFLAWAAYSPASQIRARVWSFDETEIPGPDLFERRIAAALALRRAEIPLEATDALRLVHGESDGLPGLVADRYADTLVVQLASAGCEKWRETLIEILRAQSGCARVYERSDTEGRELEGFAASTGLIAGPAADRPLEIVEHGIRYEVDAAAGQKTGFYLDQRDNRARVGLLAGGREMLNCFCYTGGFALSALAGGARSVLSIDSSARALELAKRNLALNGVEAGREVRTDTERRRARGTRLQGHQPECAEVAAAGRAARDFFLFRRRFARALPENRRRRRRGRRRLAPSSRALSRRTGPPRAHRVSRRRVPERVVAGTPLEAWSCVMPSPEGMGCFVMPGVL